MNTDINNTNLRRVFGLLRHEWVWNFFFESEDEELDMLQYALHGYCPAAAEIRVFTQYGLDDPNPPLAFDESFVSFFVPSFSTGEITVGFAINECILTSGPLRQRPRYLTKVVRDDVTGIQLSIHVNQERKLVEVWFHQLHSRTSREYIFCTFHLAYLKNALQRLWNDFPLLPGLVYSYCAIEKRPCPDCSQPPNSNTCICRPVLPKKLHPRDTNADAHRVALFCGGYEATGVVQLWQDGIPTVRVRFCAGAVGILARDMDRAQELAKWALQALASRKRISPNSGIPHAIETIHNEHLLNSSCNVDNLILDTNGVSEQGSSEGSDLLGDEMFDLDPYDDAEESEKDAYVPMPVGNIVTERRNKNNNRLIAPRPFPLDEIAAHVVNTSSLDERHRKLELRKARNRESAQRSNLRKKQALERLRKELDETEKLKMVLAAKEQTLREQNLALRREIYAANK